MKRALLSVTDKTGLHEFAKFLHDAGYELVSTGGTAQSLRNIGLTVTDVSEVTQFGEMLGGRVKTLHPAVHGGILGDLRLEEHRAQLDDAGILPFEIVCVNLYAFESTVTKPHTLEDAIESIDIGGPAMVRSAAKNFANVAVVVDPGDYPAVQDALSKGTLPSMRGRLAAKAFRHTAYYDSVVSRYLTESLDPQAFPETLTMGWKKRSDLRYGENPHQSGALYVDPLATNGVARMQQLSGKGLSYVNVQDADAAWELVSDLLPLSCVVIKHGNPCGAASLSSGPESFTAARASDPVSAFGGIVAFHGSIDLATAEAMTEKGNFLEVVVAEGFDADAVRTFKERPGWGENVRLIQATLAPPIADLNIRGMRGGALVQMMDEEPGQDWAVSTSRSPSETEWAALRFAWKLIPHVKSNAIVIAGPDRLLGVGAGQMNRVQSVRLALAQAGDATEGAALASDAFFPFPDSIETAAAAGIRAIIQPGGSKKDGEVVARANELGVTMVMTGIRHFRH